MRFAYALIAPLLLAACGGDTTDDVSTASLRDAMVDIVEPASDDIQTIAFELYDEDGELDPTRLNGSQWDQLYEAAREIEQVALALEDAASLTVVAEGETIQNEGNDGASTAEDVASYIAADPEGWASEARALAGIGQALSIAAESRDPIALDEAAFALTDSCTSCHEKFWYKQGD
ncbi:hypothetical protein WNY37_16845 [Henriciella sp. AS95]|uniref:hypothetical protein n=1 Tax=Henriciella sp. AS95 TaxID=3135782 RepID=UPI003179FEE5